MSENGKMMLQIEEDIRNIQRDFGEYDQNLKKDDYAFNYWVLTKLFNVDEETARESITEYSDDGCDCFVFFEETKELYIIQNKYYKANETLQEKYVITEFLGSPISVLLAGKYSRSPKLQEIFTKHKNETDFTIHLNFYITNNNVSESIIDRFEKYTPPTNLECDVDARIFTLDDIITLYYGERVKEKKNFDFIFKTINRGTVLNINSEEYGLPKLTDAKYILTPVSIIYDIVKKAKDVGYQLFEQNMREYIISSKFNKKMIETLKDPQERDNFFYYNNGITIICENVKEESYQTKDLPKGYEAHNPQIVNGCQTVNSIYEVLKKYPDSEIDEEFKSTFVMVKLLVLQKSEDKNKVLYQNIVRYNNSQNAIDSKAFAANKEIFFNYQDDFKKMGFLLIVKQSDKDQFKDKENFEDYRRKVEEKADLFEIDLKKITDIFIPLDKFLQIILAFTKGGLSAYQKKSQILKIESPIYLDLMEYLKTGPLTKDDLINMYLLYEKAYRQRNTETNKQVPIYYLFDFISKDLAGLEGEKLRKKYRYIFRTEKNINSMFNYYYQLVKMYTTYKTNSFKDLAYNDLLKQEIDEETYNMAIKGLSSIQQDSIVNDFLNDKIN